jgi:hypothetical protein
MAASVTSSGTQTATISTEHAVYDSTTAGTFQFAVDSTNLATGESVELRVYTKVINTSGTYRQAAVVTVLAGDPSPATISPPLLCPNGVKFTLKQLSGTGRSFDWAVWSI